MQQFSSDSDSFTPAARPAPRRSRQASVRWGSRVVTVGGDAPVRVQSMTNTDTADVIETAVQVKELARAGSEMVRITVNTPEAAQAVPAIREQLDRMGVDVPLIGDFHYNGHLLLTQYPACAEALSKYRINPGNVGKGDKRDRQFAQMIEVALRHDKPVRIGVNWGSLDQELLAALMDENARRATPWDAQQVMYQALITSAIESARRAEALGMRGEADRAVVQGQRRAGPDLRLPRAGRALRLPPAPGPDRGGHGCEGHGGLGRGAGHPAAGRHRRHDPRLAHPPAPASRAPRTVVVAMEILQALGLRTFVPSVTACPGCGRTTSTVFQDLAKQIDDYLRAQMPVWKSRYPGVETLKVAVMGCIVNGPGESKHADIGISLPGTGETPAAPVFIDGQKAMTLRGEGIAQEFQKIVEDYIERRFGAAPATH